MPAGHAFIGLINPKTPSNVGTIMRASGCYGVEKVFYTGQRYNYARQFVTDTQDVHERIPLLWVENIQAAVGMTTMETYNPLAGMKTIDDVRKGYRFPSYEYFDFERTECRSTLW